MPGFVRLNRLMPAATESSGSQWADRAIPEPHQNSLGRVIEPTEQTYSGFSDTDFAEFLRRYYLPRIEDRDL